MSADESAIKIPPHVLEYLAEQNTLTLATASPGGVPRASTFLYVNDGPDLYFWTQATATAARHVEQNPVVSFTIDAYTGDLSQTKGVQGEGECSVLLSGMEIARVADLFGQKFATLSPGTTMSISFFRITPTDLLFIDNTGGEGKTPPGTFGAEFHRKRAYSVFSELPTQSVDTVAVPLQRIKADAGEVIVRQGGPADKFFIIVDGEVEVQRDENGRTRTVTSLKPGEFFGEPAIIRNTVRTVTVTATQPTTLLAMDRDTFRDLVAQALGIAGDFDKVIQTRLRAHGAQA